MRTDKSPEDFFHKMKKKPALQKILDNIDSYTDTELENMPGQPLWIRKQLVKYRNRGGSTAQMTAEQIADQMMLSSPSPTNPTLYDVYEWTGSTWKMPCGRFTRVTIDVEPGDLLMYFNKSGFHHVFLSSAQGTLTDQQWNFFCSQARFVDKMHRTQYSKAISDRNSVKNPVSLNQPDNSGWFRIQRH